MQKFEKLKEISKKLQNKCWNLHIKVMFTNLQNLLHPKQNNKCKNSLKKEK